VKTIQELLQYAARKKIAAARFNSRNSTLSLQDGSTASDFVLQQQNDLEQSINQILGNKHMIFDNWKAQKQTFKGLGDVIFAWNGSELFYFMPPEGMKAFKTWKQSLQAGKPATKGSNNKNSGSKNKVVAIQSANSASGLKIKPDYVHTKGKVDLEKDVQWNGTLDGLLYLLVNGGGSDLHITAGLAPLYRVDGEIKNIGLPQKKRIRRDQRH